MDRREFLRRSGVWGSAAILGESILTACGPDIPGSGTEYHPSSVPTGRMIDRPASESPIDHVVIVMMENRSFDHYLGWLSRDPAFLERGLSRYGANFSVDAQSMQTFVDPQGTAVDTFHLDSGSMANPWRGCGFEDPGHSWTAGHAQRDGGFLAADSGNDRYALGYHEPADLPFHSRMARRFTTFDRYHCSQLTSTQTNRRYLHSAQSGGFNYNYIPIKELGFKFDTIWDRLRAAGVPVMSYFSDAPSLAFWGERMGPIISPIDRYFSDCRKGRLPAVTFIDPPYLPLWQADDHPHADPASGQRFLRDIFKAFVDSPHWNNGAFILTYDEWGGFFDHVRPPLLPDVLASADDSKNFGQAGFRVPTVLASPYSRPGYVDHRTYDHTSIMRFLQWRFLGAPAEGPGTGAAPWSLTIRDRSANNIGASLGADNPDPGLFDLGDLPLRWPTPACGGLPYIPPPGSVPPQTKAVSADGTTTTVQLPTENASVVTGGGPGLDFQELDELEFYSRVGLKVEPSSMADTWVKPS